MANPQLIQSLNEDETALLWAARCLKEYLDVHWRVGRPYEVLYFLAQETVKELENGKPAKFKNHVIQNAVLRHLGKDSSAWISPIWKRLNQDVLPSIKESIEGFAKEKGYEFYPGLGKTDNQGGSGNVTLYFLTAQKTNSENELDGEILSSADIRYLPAIKIKAAWWARWLFEKDYSITGWRKLAYIWLPIIWLICVLLFVMVVWLSFSLSKAALNTQSLVSIIFMFGAILYCRHIYAQLSVLMADHFALAPDFLLGIGELGVCIEFAKERIDSKASTRVLRLVKYTAECPRCGAEVILDKGEPIYPRKIIGRCAEYPQDHFYSFDRFSRSGVKL